jgi:hypothetical protein
MPFRNRYYWDFNSSNQMELSITKLDRNHGKAFYIADQDVQVQFLDITKNVWW